MRVNANRKVHRMKRDPFKVLTRIVVALLILMVVGVGVFYFCSKTIENDYIQKRNATIQKNEEDEVAFNTRMNELRANANNSFFDTTGNDDDPKQLQYWEKSFGETVWRIEDNGIAAPENTTTITASRSELMLGGLMLINAWHPLPGEFTDEALVTVGSTSGYKIPVKDNTVKLFRPAYDALFNALEAAAGEGLQNYIVQEGYRTNERQTELFNERMQKLQNKYSGDILIEQTKKEVNYPGTSEYQTGFSFNMRLYPNPESIDFVDSDQGKWLVENGWKYGIIFRFPTRDFPNASWEDKSHKTGVSVELNVFRYVGEAHAAAMRTLGYCLEEYIEFLMKHPHVSIYENGSLRYEIYRIAETAEPSFNLPVPNPARNYQVSFDNMGGIVMAYSY